jgi:cytochrome P450
VFDPIRTGNIIVDPDTYLDEKMYHELLTKIRHEEPLLWVEPKGYRPFWVVSKYADIKEIGGAPSKFLNRPRSFLLTKTEEDQIFAATGEYVATRSVIQVDGMEHRLLRQVTQSWFQPDTIRKLEVLIRQIAQEFVDKLAANPGVVDFVNDIALWYPLRVIMLILGLPPEDAPWLLSVTQQNFNSNDPDTDSAPGLEGILDAQQKVAEYFSPIIKSYRAYPKDNVASVIANAKINDRYLTDLEMISYYLTLVTAGHDTTSSTVAGAMLALLQNPEQLAQLQDDTSLLGRSAVDEFLRWVTPIKHFFRTATEDYPLGGKMVHAGENLMMCYPSANRDEDVYEDPFSFRVDRKPNRQFAFGYGAHVCLGQHLAKLELRIFYEELLPRIKKISLAGPPVLFRANFVQGLKRLLIDIVVDS